MSRAFETKIPLLNSSDRTKNLKAKTVYSNMIKTANLCPTTTSGANYTGTLRFNSNGNMTNYRSYELATTMGKGAAFVWDNCCKGLAGLFRQSKNKDLKLGIQVEQYLIGFIICLIRRNPRQV